MPKESLNTLVPRPQEMRLTRGSFEWTDGVILVVEPEDRAGQMAARTLVSHLEERGVTAPEILATREEPLILGRRQILAGDPCRNWLLLKALREEDLEILPSQGTEGYLLCVTPRRILVAAISSAGVYYGLQTLAQLAAASAETGRIPCAVIRDHPAVPHRGMLLDLSGGEVLRPEALRQTIRRMAHYKLNTLVLELGGALRFPSRPGIGEGRDRLTPSDIEDLADFARQHHVDVLPCLSSPGRMEDILSDPSLAELREGDGEPLAGVLNVSHPDACPLLETLYGDVCGAFPSQVHYAGGDGALAIGGGRSAPLAAAVGRETLFLRHIKLVRDILQAAGKRMAIAADPFESGFHSGAPGEGFGMEALRQVPRDVVLAARHSGEVQGFSFGESAREMGFDLHLWTSNAASGHLFPAVGEAARNVQSFLQYAERTGALGVIQSGRKAPGDCALAEYDWPFAAFFAEWAWSSPGRTWENAAGPVAESFYGPGTGRVADVIRFLGQLSDYFSWARSGPHPPDLELFFGPLTAHPLGSSLSRRRGARAQVLPSVEAEQRLAMFRHDLFAARDSLIQVRIMASAGREHLDCLDLALEQCEALADLVEARHLLSSGEPDARGRLTELLRRLDASLPPLAERYRALRERTAMPQGTGQDVRQFERLAREVRDCCDRQSVRV